MANDIDMTPSSDTPGGATAPPPDQSSQQPAPQVSQDQAQQDISGLEKNNTAISEWLTKQAEHQAQESKFYQDQMAPLLGEIQKMRSEPDMAPPAAPQLQPIGEQHKASLSENIVHILKFGALMGLAFGARGKGGAAVGKAAIAGAISGYTEGRNHTRDLSLKLWERNNALQGKMFTERNQQWHDLMQDKRLKLQETMDLLGKYGQMWQSERASDAAQRQDFMAAEKYYQDNQRLIKDYKAQIQKARKAMWDALGKGKDADDYKQRLIARHGRSPANEEELDKWMGEYTPEQHIDDMAKEAAAKAKMKKEAELAAKAEADQEAKEQQQRMTHPGHKQGSPGNPLGLNFD